MPITTLDPDTALIVIDLQKGLLGTPTVQPMAEVAGHAAALAAAFRTHALPVVLVNVDVPTAPGRTEQPLRHTQFPAGWTDLISELDQQPSDILITKHTWGAFSGTGLAERLHTLGATQVVIAGVATSMGVESTARQAHEAGFHVTLALDAMTDLTPEAHLHATTRIFPRLGETGTTDDILALLNTRAR